MTSLRRRRRRSEHGAAAVEFALVTPLLFLVVFGILQYGLYFFDTLGTRNGVREAARQGVVKTFPACSEPATTDWAKLECNVSSQIDAVTGPTAVKVVAPSGWVKGKPLIVCAVVSSDGAIGLLPMPNNGYITTKTAMSIEADDPVPSGVSSPDADPSGASWGWCA